MAKRLPFSSQSVEDSMRSLRARRPRHPFKDQLWQLVRMEAWADVVRPSTHHSHPSLALYRCLMPRPRRLVRHIRPAHPHLFPCLLPPCPTLLPLQVTEPALAPFLSSTVLSSPSLEHLFATLLSDKLAVSWMLSTVKLAGLLEVCMGGGAGMVLIGAYDG